MRKSAPRALRLGSWLTAFRFSSAERMQTALFISAALHLTLLVGVYLRAPDLKFFKDSKSQLDVVLVNSKSADQPLDPLALAQANLDGGGNTDQDRRARSPLPTLDENRAEADAGSEEVNSTMRRLADLEEETKRMMTQLQAKKVVQANSAEAVEPKDAAQEIKRREGAQSNADARDPARLREIAKLEAQISKTWDEYQKRPKRKFVGARTREYKFAQYIEDWRARIERVGNINYPQAARRNRIYGSLLLSLAIRADGSIEDVEIVRSSGSKILDAAAMHIIELAQPFAPFSPELRKETDVLTITRTWTFTKADRLVAE
jgi:periplasmic protein TonB